MDKINHPQHYTAGKVECIEAIESATAGLSGIEAVCVANVIKYVWRFKLKNGVVRHINLGSIRHFKLVENNIKQFTQHINLCFFCALF